MRKANCIISISDKLKVKGRSERIISILMRKKQMMKRGFLILSAFLCGTLGISAGVDAQHYPSGTPSPTISTDIPFNDQASNWNLSFHRAEDFFPFGFMSVESENISQMADVFNMGANCIHSWDFQENTEATRTYLTIAAENNLSVIQQLPGEGDPITDENYWASYFPTLGAYASVAAWYLPDEIPDFDPSLEHARDLYNWSKKYDPLQRPVYGNAGTSNLQVIRELVQYSDVIWSAAYPNYYDEPRAYVTWAMKDRMAPATQGTGKSYGAILEFFDPKSWGHPGELSTPTEIRCDTYQALIAGAEGIWFYSWYRGTMVDGHEPTLNEIAKMADEIIGSGSLRDVFLSPEKRTAQISIVSGPSQSPQVEGKTFESIQWTQRTYDGKEYLMAVNVATADVSAQFNTLPVENGQASVLFEDRVLPISNSQISDTFKPCEVHIYIFISQSFLPEDLNLDGSVNHIDVNLCVSFLLGFNSDPNLTIERVDVNGDGEVNAIDIQQIITMIP